MHLESQFQQDELQQWELHFELILFRTNTESHKQLKTNQISKFDHSILSAREDLNTYVEIHPPLPKQIMRPLEDFVRNKHITCLGYDKEVYFNNLDYSKPIKF